MRDQKIVIPFCPAMRLHNAVCRRLGDAVQGQSVLRGRRGSCGWTRQQSEATVQARLRQSRFGLAVLLGPATQSENGIRTILVTRSGAHATGAEATAAMSVTLRAIQPAGPPTIDAAASGIRTQIIDEVDEAVFAEQPCSRSR